MNYCFVLSVKHTPCSEPAVMLLSLVNKS